VLTEVSRFGWEHVEPSIFGTLFERLLDPSKRSQIGAHYTSRQDITDLVEPVLMAPLRREWAAVQAGCEKLAADASAARTPKTKADKLRRRDRSLQDFIERLAHVTVLDPACGSGNFLYVALHLLLDLEKEVITYASRCGLPLLPQVRPTQLAGIEINPYAQQLAQVVVWIGFLQWKHHNGFTTPRNPILQLAPPGPDCPSSNHHVPTFVCLSRRKIASEMIPSDEYAPSDCDWHSDSNSAWSSSASSLITFGSESARDFADPRFRDRSSKKRRTSRSSGKKVRF